MSFNKILNESIDICIHEIKKEKNRRRIEDEILSPLIEFILEKIKPYILATSIFLIAIMLMILCILFLIIISNKTSPFKNTLV